MSNSVDSIIKKYGDIISKGTGIVDEKKAYFPVSPAIDLSIGGGIMEGSFASFIGPPGCGKSTTILQIIKNALDKEFWIKGQPRKVFYMDVEHRLKKMNMEGVDGLDPELINHIHSTKSHILTAEDYLLIGRELTSDPENEGAIIVYDSSSALCPAEEMVKDPAGNLRTTLPKLLSHWCKQMAPRIKIMNVTVIFIQHLITNTSGWGETWVADGGEKIKFAFDYRLMTKNKPKKWIESGDTPIGQIVEWEVYKSGGGQSGLIAKSHLRYGHGLDAQKELSILAVDFGIIAKNGSWYSIELDGKTHKWQGEDKLYYGLLQNKEVFDHVLKALKKIKI